MSTFQIEPTADYRNESWILTGGSSLNAVWSDSNDSTYASNPANKGRAAVTFPIDISSDSIPDGSSIESVTVYVRAARTDTTPRRLTVNVLPHDRTSCFHSRSIALSQTITTYEVGTYTHDAYNRGWCKDTLNQLICQVFTYDSGGSTDTIRVYELYAVVNFRTKPTVTITAPTGNVPTASPVVSFSYTQSDGDIQAYATYKIYTAAQVSAVTFNPDVTPSTYPASGTYTVKPGDSLWAIATRFYGNGELWPTLYAASTLRSGDPNLIYPGEVVTVPGIGTVSGDITSFTLPFSLAAGDYFVFLNVTSTHGCTSPWASHAFTVSAGGSGNPGSPGGSLGGIGTGGGGGFESVIADGPTSNVYLSLRDGSNLMGVQQADFETLTDSTNTWVGTNCSVAQDFTVQYTTGGASMSVTASSAADMSVASGWMGVAAGAPLTFRVQCFAKTTGRTVKASIAFADDGFNPVGTAVTGSISDASTTWTELEVTGFNVPTGATLVQVTIQFTAPANGEVHNLDHIGLMYGTDSAWSNGGHASRNLLSSYASNAEDPANDPTWTADNGATVTRVATTGTGSDGVKAFKVLYNATASSITEVGVATSYADASTSGTATVNKPSGVANGDVLVAYIATDGIGLAGGVAPSGWTMVDQAATSGSALTVLMRDGLAADPPSWTFSLAGNRTRCRTTCVAYRGAAPTSAQFTREAISTSLSGSVYPQTPTVSNSDPNAWRLSAFAVDDNSSGGAMTANVTPSSGPQPIAYVGRGSVDKTDDTTSTYTINKPSGTIQGDMMFAAMTIVMLDGAVSAPSGWTILDQNVASVGYGSMVLVTMYKFAGASEPSSYTGSVSGNMQGHNVSAVAYRNVNPTTPWIAHGGQADNTATFYTPSEYNTNSNSWWIAAFGDVTDGGSSVNASGDERTDDTTWGDIAPNTSIHDSNGKISTGSHYAGAVASNDYNLYSSCAWIGILNATTTGTTPGGNETERQDAVAGSSSPYIDLAVYDSNGSAATGNTTVYGTCTGSGVASSVSFLGFLLPGTTSVSGEAGCTLTNYVDLRNVDPAALSASGNTVSLEMAALGSIAGTPHLKLYAYNGNELISSQVQEGRPFNTTVWTTSALEFIVPSNTTRLKMGLSAINLSSSDYMLFDRVQMALGTTSTYRVGTGSSAHPIYSLPVVEYAEDLGTGYGDWQPLAGTGGTPFVYNPDTGLCSIVDQTMTPLSSRKYRAKTVSFGLAGEQFVSPYGPESAEVTLYATDWWLKDMSNPDLSMKLSVYLDDSSSGATGGTGNSWSTTDTSTAFQPLGRSRPVVVTEGYKGDLIPIVMIMDSQEFAQFNQILSQRHTLYLQSNIDRAWWVRPAGDIAHSVQATGNMNANPLRFVSLTFIEVDPAI